MTLITSTGYHGTGSSAIIDLLSEYDNVQPSSNYEVKLLYGYHGVNDLYYYMIQKPAREVSNYAIHDFYKQCRQWAVNGTSMNYEIYFNHNFMKYTDEYIRELGGKSFGRYYLAEADDMNFIKVFLRKAVNKIYRTYYMKFVHKDHSEDFDKFIPMFMEQKPFYMHTTDEEEFLRITKSYLNKLFSSICEKPYMMIDHFVSTSTIDDCTRYFDDARVFVVDRDPRDIFLSERYHWRGMDIPSNDVDAFCEYYRWSREIPEYNENSNVMKVQFEDLVFKYDDTVRQIENYLGLSADNHVNPRQRFNPDISRNHCKLWKKYPDEKENLSIIESRLEKWIYDI